MNNPNVNRLFSCFADPKDTKNHPLEAFIFSLKNSEALPPFKCLATDKTKAIYKGFDSGPSFGEAPFFKIHGNHAQNSQAVIDDPYSPPKEVDKKDLVLAGTRGLFTPDNYEVFYLA